MDLLVAIGLALAVWLRLVARVVDGQIEAFAGLLGGYRPDGWPIGVQEEDRDRPWGCGATAAVQNRQGVAVSPLAARVRFRS